MCSENQPFDMAGGAVWGPSPSQGALPAGAIGAGTSYAIADSSARISSWYLGPDRLRAGDTEIKG